MVAIQRAPSAACWDIGRVREISSRCQRLRKEAGLNVTDKCSVTVTVAAESSPVFALLQDAEHLALITGTLRTQLSVEVTSAPLPEPSDTIAASTAASLDYDASTAHEYGVYLTRISA
jgi:hypothetical protein